MFATKRSRARILVAVLATALLLALALPAGAFAAVMEPQQVVAPSTEVYISSLNLKVNVTRPSLVKSLRADVTLVDGNGYSVQGPMSIKVQWSGLVNATNTWNSPYGVYRWSFGMPYPKTKGAVTFTILELTPPPGYTWDADDTPGGNSRTLVLY